MTSRYFDELTRIQGQLNALLDRVMTGTEGEAGEPSVPGTWSPLVDVVETEDGFTVYAELPGVRREDIELTLRERRLELSGQRQADGGEGGYSLVERAHGPFQRVFELGGDVDPESLSARFDHGVLEITLTKGEGARRTTRVPVTREGE